MAARARHDEKPRSDARNIVAAYVGSTRNAETLVPAVDSLRSVCPSAALWLLWPMGVSCPPTLERHADGRIDYPVPEEAREAALRVEETVIRIAAADARVALVFSAAGYEPFLPAYLCYLAGVPHRAAFSAEFGGRVLSAAFAPPARDGAARHLELVRAARSLLDGTQPAVHRSDRCDG